MFKKVVEDDYHQKVESEETIKVNGIFHESYSYAKSEDSDGARLVKKPQSMILVMFDDGNKLEKDFILEMSGRVYVVTEKHNIKNLDVAFDVSLELKL